LKRNPKILDTIGRSDQDWVRTLPFICELIFIEMYVELPHNLPETPPYYALGATDPRWHTVLNERVGGEISGLQYLVEIYTRKGKKL
jgi:hypothetical protein